MPSKYEAQAAAFCDAIRKLASNPDNLYNLECYLSHLFPEWLSKFANTPETLVCEMREFANMEV